MSLREAQVHLLQSVPLDPTYVNSIYFKDSSAQRNYFLSKKKWSYSEMSYVRIDAGVIRVKTPQTLVNPCNYLMFKEKLSGQDHEAKWFYAFITGTVYVADNVTEVHFEIDTIQTWMFDWEMLDCIIERGHTPTDNPGDNLIDEDLECGKDMIVEWTEDYNMGEIGVWVLTSHPGDTSVSPIGKLYRGIYCSLWSYKFMLPRDLERLNNFVKTFVDSGQENAIIAIYQAPGRFDLDDESLTFHWRISKPSNKFGTHTVRNKKLLTSPYKNLVLSNNMGSTAVYNWEDFEEDGLQPAGKYGFKISGVTVPAVEILCYPINYRGMQYDYDSGLAMGNFPQCAWVGDPFKVWLAQHSLGQAHSAAMKIAIPGGAAMSAIAPMLKVGAATSSTAIGPVAGSAAAGGAASAVAAGGGAVAAGSVLGPALIAVGAAALAVGGALFAKKNELENTPPQIHGQARQTNLNYALSRVKYTAYYMAIKQEFAEAIDDYFDVYGYAIHKKGTPLLKVRPHWTYIKTAGCNMRGPIPALDLAQIKGIFDRGITFWATGEEVGNYGQDNSPR